MASTNPGAAVTNTQNTVLPVSDIQQMSVIAVALTPVSVAANTTAEQTFTIAGLFTSDMVFVNKPTAQAGLGIVNVRVSALNTLAVTYVNGTAAPIVPTAETYNILVIRPQPAMVSGGLPNSMPLL